MKLHVGCGDKKIKGYINIDVVETKVTDLVCDTMQLPYESGTVDTIYACSILEHFGRRDNLRFFRGTSWKNVLEYWASLLKEGGCLYISVPDFEAVCREYLSNKNLHAILGLVLGGQKNEEDLHGMLFDSSVLAEELTRLGFSSIETYNWRTFEAFSNDEDYDDYSAAYLPHNDVEQGRHMMLNLKATK
jgi:SAM-dependent methyltransferase